VLRRFSLERRLFGWLLALALVPALVLVAIGTWSSAGWIEWLGTLGPWARLADSGRELFDAAAPAAAADPLLAEALERHRQELSASLVFAQRWAFLGERIAALLIPVAVVCTLILAVLALLVAQKLARQLARPIRELVEWTDRIAREEPLPAPTPREERDVQEVRLLRSAFRRAQTGLGRARRRALEAERVRIWGEMARRVAHEMKNPLTPLRLAAHRLERAADGRPEIGEAAVVIREEAGRLEELAQQFSALGRPPAGPRSPVDLAELLDSLLRTDVPAGIDVRLDLPPGGVPLVEAYYEPLVRAFRNVIRNAVEAVEMARPRGPAAAGAERAPRRIEASLRAAPVAGTPWVEVVITDTGAGLPAGAGDRIFEPDFTTKSRGTGLGLALVRQAIAAHGGDISAVDRPGGGAAFTIMLPALQGEPEPTR
jgi:two-component system, NtrC family, nitrogen regulation sensor histidine kinase NtrY